MYSTSMLIAALSSCLVLTGCSDPDPPETGGTGGGGTGGTGGTQSQVVRDDSVTYNFSNIADNDFAQLITLEAGDVLEFGTCQEKLASADNIGNDTAIRLVQESNGTEIASNDDNCDGSSASHLEVQISSAGRYVMRVDCIDGANPCAGVLAFLVSR